MNYVDALRGIYAYTGCVYTPAFYHKSKVQPLSLVMKHQKYLDTFLSLEYTLLKKSLFKSIGEVSCAIYGYSRKENIQQVIKCESEKKNKPKPNGNLLNRTKAVDPTTFSTNYNKRYE